MVCTRGRGVAPPGGGGGGVGWEMGSRDSPVHRGWSGHSNGASPCALQSGPGFFFKKIPHDTQLKPIGASWGIILSHICWGSSGPPCPLRRPVGGP